MAKKIIQTPQGLIEYAQQGEGIPILILHGGHSSCKETLAHKGLDTALFQWIIPSRPGYGQTPLGGHNSPGKAANLMAALLDKLNIKKTVVYGISAGGLTAIALAAHHPEKVAKLVLASAVTKKWLNQEDFTYRLARRMFSPRWEGTIWAMVHFFAQLMPGMMARSFFPQFSTQKKTKITKAEARELCEELKNYRSGKGFSNDLDQALSSVTLEKIKCPCLILHSRNDASVAIDHAEHAHQRIRSSSLHIFNNKWGHMLWIGEDYKQVRDVLVDFLLK